MRGRIVLASWLLAASGCAEDKSFALVSVLSAGGAFNDVGQLIVSVQSGPHLDTLRYPLTPSATPLRFDDANALTFSISFKTSHEGPLWVGVTPLDGSGAVLGFGMGSATIDVGDVTDVSVRVRLGEQPPEGIADGGFGAGGGDGGVGGDAPVDRADAGDVGRRPEAGVEAGPPCEPASPTACNGGTCFVSCQPGGRSAGMCTASGTKKVGEICANNEDCVAGSQCFSFMCGGAQMIRTCLRFCRNDDVCGGGRCNTPVPCMNETTPFHVCSQPCDPTGDATVGCATGLRCLLFAREVPDCECAGPGRAGGDGAVCNDSNECRPGLLCVSMAGQKNCRPLCKLSDGKCPAGTTCTKLVAPDFTTYGGCLP